MTYNINSCNYREATYLVGLADFLDGGAGVLSLSLSSSLSSALASIVTFFLPALQKVENMYVNLIKKVTNARCSLGH
jgi:hypothetical protein